MQRDMSLIRDILLTLEAEDSGYAPDHLHIEGYTDEQIGYRILLSMEAGLIEGQKLTTFDNDSPSAIATRITWAGHEFLDEARDKGRWKEAQRLVQEKGGGAVSIGILTQVLSALAKQSLGLN